jgi:hypothetical protein
MHRLVADRGWLRVRPMPRLRADAADPVDPPVAALAANQA